MPEGYLQCTLEQTLGPLSLRVACVLRAPWTIVFGPSGAGKTSLLRLLAGLARPDAGRVLLGGRTLVDTAAGVWVPPARRGIGFVSQRPALFAHMTVTENVSFALGTMGRAARRERVAAMLSLFQASALAAKKPAELSGGEKQRVALARALAAEPKLLLLDEPFTGMDGDLKATILAELNGWLAARETPALYVSHDVAEAFQTSAEALVLAEGRVTAQGPAAVVLARQREELLRRLG